MDIAVSWGCWFVHLFSRVRLYLYQQFPLPSPFPLQLAKIPSCKWVAFTH
jgi:hypothetical protein